jgi:hypothetical protein
VAKRQLHSSPGYWTSVTQTLHRTEYLSMFVHVLIFNMLH